MEDAATSSEAATVRLSVYQSLPFDGRGPSQTCLNIMRTLPRDRVTPMLFAPRMTIASPPELKVMAALRPPFDRLPYRVTRGIASAALRRSFEQAIDRMDPKTSIAHFWPGADAALVRRAKARGIVTVREMINCYRGYAKRVLDEAYGRLGLPPTHGISQRSIEAEREMLLACDYVFASRQTRASVLEAGVDPARIAPTTFGWNPSRFQGPVEPAPGEGPGVTALFVGSIGVRKGVPQMLAAWKQSGVDGRLILVGAVSDEIKPLLAPYHNDASIQFRPYTRNLTGLYRTADMFVLPTFEEGSPAVVHEAAGCGLPVITTAMGAGSLIRDGDNGLVVPAGDVAALADAIRTLAASPDRRRAMADRARATAALISFERLGPLRAAAIAGLLARTIEPACRGMAELERQIAA